VVTGSLRTGTSKNSVADSIAEPPSRLPAGVAEHLVAAYRPLHRVFMITTLCYYVFVTLAHIPDESGAALAILASISSATAIAAFIAWRVVATRPLSVGAVGGITAIVQVLMVANVLA